MGLTLAMAPAPQHPPPARSAAWAYFSRTTSVISDFSIASSCWSASLLSYPSRNIKISAKEKSRRALGVLAFGIGAAFGDQEIHQPLHDLVIGVTDQRGRLAHLGDQTDHHQRLDVVGKRGGRDLQSVLQLSLIHISEPTRQAEI